MRQQMRALRIMSVSTLAIAAMAVALTTQAWGTVVEKVIYSFTGGADGAVPAASLILDSAGNFYGTTSAGGTAGCGTVFELIRNPDGTWKESVLYTFTGGGDGAQPQAALIFDSAGNLYGTASAGGAGYGVVFELMPNADGTWSESVLRVFNGGRGGAHPQGRLLFDSAGVNLYGTTSAGGNLVSCGGVGCGVVFELSPQSGGSWAEQVLYFFTGGKNGGIPYGGLTFDAVGNLYGTASTGGVVGSPTFCPGGCGVVFELTPAGGKWGQTVLYAFKGASRDGATPQGDVIFDSAGNLYGTTSGIGRLARSNVFRLVPNSLGWSEQVLYHFTGTDGSAPLSDIALGADSKVYGTTSLGGTSNHGVVFELIPPPSASFHELWAERVLHSFTGKQDGGNPKTGLVDHAGSLYGTAQNGGITSVNCPQGCGVVFQMTTQ